MKGRALIGCVVQFVWIYFFFHLRRKKVGGVVQVVLSSGRCIFFFFPLLSKICSPMLCVSLVLYLLSSRSLLDGTERNGME